MSRFILQLERALQGGTIRMGELLIGKKDAAFILHHYKDDRLEDLETYSDPEDARHIALYDVAGNFRPLKTAPTLQRGWIMLLPTIHDLYLALNYFYPAMLGTWVHFLENRCAPVPFRETVNRQTGMYAITKKISDETANTLIGSFCTSEGKCLKTILWTIQPGIPVTSLPESKFDPHPGDEIIPLLCTEPCHLLVAAARDRIRNEHA